MFAKFRSGVYKLSEWMDYCGRVLVVLMLALICTNVITSVAGFPIYGTYEIATFLTGGVIAFGLSFCGMNGGHITVTFVTDKLKPGVRRICLITNNFLSAAICAITGYQCWVYAGGMAAKGEITSALYIPVAPIIYVLSVSFIILSLTFIVHMIGQIIRQDEVGGTAEDEMVKEIMNAANTAEAPVEEAETAAPAESAEKDGEVEV